MNISDFSKQVKQKVSTPYLLVTSLEEEVTYEFSVRAETINYGPEVRHSCNSYRVGIIKIKRF